MQPALQAEMQGQAAEVGKRPDADLPKGTETARHEDALAAAFSDISINDPPPVRLLRVVGSQPPRAVVWPATYF